MAPVPLLDMPLSPEAQHSNTDTNIMPNSGTYSQPASMDVQIPRRRRFKLFKSLFSCLVPQTEEYHQNRWNNKVKKNSRYKWIIKNLIIKEIGKGGFAVDDTTYDLPLGCFRSPTAILPHSLKKMDLIETNADEKACISMRIGIPRFSYDGVSKNNCRANCKCLKKRVGPRIVDSNQNCAICWDSFKVGEKVCWSKIVTCRHGFHLDCMVAWLKDHDKCPMCRCDYIKKR